MVAAGQVEIAAVEALLGPGGEEGLGLAVKLRGFIATERDGQRRRAVRDVSDRAHPIDLLGGQAELRLQPGMNEGLEVEQAADRGAALDEVGR